MRDNRASNTALGVTVVRAVHQLMDELPHILDDPVSPMLLSPDMIRRIRQDPDRHKLPRSRGLRSAVVLRSRYAEDELFAAVRSGVAQFINIGAGYDTFSCRQPTWPHDVRLLEVDHPATQQAKRKHFAAMRVAFPENVEFLPLDLETEDFAHGVRGTGIDPRCPAFVACLGVLTYLRPATVEKIFREVAGMARGTGMVFTIASREEQDTDDATSVEARAAAHGEPWLTRVDSAELKARLMECSFHRVSFLEPAEAAARYYVGRTDLQPPRRMRICLAVV